MPGGGYVTNKQRTVDTSRFAMIPRNDVPRSAFDIQHGHKTSFNAGYLVPIYVDEVLPGDSFRLKMTAFCRLSTPIVPVMDNMVMESFFFFVPNRLVWENFERFMGEQLTITDTTNFLIPQLPVVDADCVVGSMVDYFGITLNNNAGGTLNVNALPFRGYNLIWNDWFRDENLDNPAAVATGDGPDATVSYPLQNRGKRHDYFTSALPWPAKALTGSAAFNSGAGSIAGPLVPGLNGHWPGGVGGIPPGNMGAPVTGLGIVPGTARTVGSLAISDSGSRSWTTEARYGGAALVVNAQQGVNFPEIRVLINDIRTANMLQVMMERNARGGTRYAELVRSQFGVTSPDARLQRPEYLGGGRAQITINPVAQTSETTADGVLGELAGIGTAIAHGHGFSQSFTEHGYILGLVSVRADLSYQQGLNRMWSRRTIYDIYTPGLAHLGEQPIMSREIYSEGVAADDAVFGYQERWAEYKFKPSRISGVFRSSSPTPLDMWHLSQQFSARPALNNVFIREDPPVDRVLQVATTVGEQFLLDAFFENRAVRCMPMFSLPGMGPRL